MPSSRSHWSHREPRTISKLLLRMMIVLFVLCLLAQLSGCTNTRMVYVPVPVVPLPASLTAETPQPDLPDPFTWGASLNLNVALLSALAQCNRDKADIRTFENNRAGQTDGTIKR
ncbi:Rz1-like lysis system protein LysC [Enterobacter chengduensis]|uniref:Rz1-like lysis system protein LysC n=1 Tax=Enterobacter chengduensis TaxID=2494701 RepID=UPI004058A45E